MKSVGAKMSLVTQNVILGTVTGSMVAYNLRLIFTRVGATDLMWILFFFLGPALGYLSGRERQRIERLKGEKQKAEEDLNTIQAALKRSTKKYRLLVEQANDAIFLTTTDGRFLLFNEATSTLSGFSKNELKNMNISKIQVEENPIDKHRKVWLDNGVHRYEETWKNKDGEYVFLEINAKWIQVGEHQLILHVARDVLRQYNASQEEKIQDIRRLFEDRLMEASSIQNTICSRLISPVSQTVQMLQTLAETYPYEKDRLSGLIEQWKHSQKLMDWLSKKNARDTKTTPCRWDLNEILKQELRFIELETQVKGFVNRVSLAPELPAVFGFGRDFSMAFGLLFKALLASLESSKQNGFSISTKALDDHNIIEIKIDDNIAIKECLCKISDPFFHDGADSGEGKVELEFLNCQRLFESMGTRIDVGQLARKGTLVRIRVPALQEQEEDKPMSVAESSKHSVIL